MSSFLSVLTGAVDLIVVVAAFSLIIIIHELGHFLAARWAGIRVLAFALGFGPALVSYRPGLGWRRGSSQAEVDALRKDAAGVAGEARESARATLSNVSWREYRLNSLPFGGYVKMLGQDDSDPAATSDAPDSYQRCLPWKRMVVISAGVTANLITAVLMFIAVFTIGLSVEPAKIGVVEPGLPASTVMATNAGALGVTQPGLKPGDEVISIDGEKPDSFNDLVLATAMSKARQPIHLEVRRAGIAEPLRFDVTPAEDDLSHLLSIGVGPAFSNELGWPDNAAEIERFKQALAARGLDKLEPGMRLTAVNGRPSTTPYAIEEAVQSSGGKPVDLTFTGRDGKPTTLALHSTPSYQHEIFKVGDGKFEASHFLGLTPVLAVRDVVKDGAAQKAGLLPGDVFARLGATEWPSVPGGVAEIRRQAGGTIAATVMRKNDNGAWQETNLGQIHVDSGGKIGFEFRDSSDLGSWVTRFPPRSTENGALPSGANLPIPGGSRVLSIDGKPVKNFAELRTAIEAAAADHAGAPVVVHLEIELPVAAAAPDGRRPTETIAWTIPSTEVAGIARLGFESPLSLGLFKTEQISLKGAGIADSVGKGFKEARRVMAMTYLTFARLVQGSVKVEHLKGPVGIAHVGVVLLDRGWVWLLFFMALISVNLAVINFLPIPIADGGHMVYLIYEQITGRPPPIAVQNAAALAGIILLGAVFLLVTYHDAVNWVRWLRGG